MSCGLGTCVDPDCYLCTVVAKETQPRGRKWVHPKDVAPPEVVPSEAEVAAIRAELRETYGRLF